MAYLHLTQTVADAFNALADEVQILSDRKTILEHKLRFAHEQVSSQERLFFLDFLFVIKFSPLYNCTALAFTGAYVRIGRDTSFGARNMMRYLSSRSRAAQAAEIDNLFITDLHCPSFLLLFILAKGARHILSQILS